MFEDPRNKEALDIKTERYALLFQKAMRMDVEDLMCSMRNLRGRHAIPVYHFASSISCTLRPTVNKFYNEGILSPSEQLKEHLSQLWGDGKLRVLGRYWAKASIAESELDNEGLEYLPISIQLAEDLLQVNSKAIKVLQRLFSPYLVWMPGGVGVAYGHQRVVSSLYVDDVAYAIHNISPLVKDVEYLPGITISMLVEETRELVLLAIDAGELPVYTSKNEGSLMVKHEDLAVWLAKNPQATRLNISFAEDLKETKATLDNSLPVEEKLDRREFFRSLTERIQKLLKPHNLQDDKSAVLELVGRCLDLRIKKGAYTDYNEGAEPKRSYGYETINGFIKDMFSAKAGGNTANNIKEEKRKAIDKLSPAVLGPAFDEYRLQFKRLTQN
jgi:hypothetical protein